MKCFRLSPPWYRRPCPEELDGIRERQHAVEVVVGAGDGAAGPLHGRDGLLRGPLHLEVELGCEGVHPLAGQVEPELVPADVEDGDLGAAQRRHVHRPVRGQPPSVHQQLDGGQGDGRELALKNTRM